MINAFQMPLGLVAQLKEKADIILYSKIFAVYNLIADILLIMHFGIWGAVFATGTAVLCKNIFIWFFVRKDASFKGMGRYFSSSVSFWICVAFLSLILKYFLSNFILVFIFGIIIFTISFGLQFRFNLFEQYEKNAFKLIASKSRKLRYIANFLRIQMA